MYSCCTRTGEKGGGGCYPLQPSVTSGRYGSFYCACKLEWFIPTSSIPTLSTPTLSTPILSAPTLSIYESSKISTALVCMYAYAYLLPPLPTPLFYSSPVLFLPHLLSSLSFFYIPPPHPLIQSKAWCHQLYSDQLHP